MHVWCDIFGHVIIRSRELSWSPWRHRLPQKPYGQTSHVIAQSSMSNINPFLSVNYRQRYFTHGRWNTKQQFSADGLHWTCTSCPVSELCICCQSKPNCNKYFTDVKEFAPFKGQSVTDTELSVTSRGAFRDRCWINHFNLLTLNAKRHSTLKRTVLQCPFMSNFADMRLRAYWCDFSNTRAPQCTIYFALYILHDRWHTAHWDLKQVPALRNQRRI